MPKYQLPPDVQATLDQLAAQIRDESQPCPSLACHRGYVQGGRICPVCQGDGYVLRKDAPRTVGRNLREL